ncbi:MAG: glycoside hydrolase family 28 protein [Bacteroidales bacterium]|nr:glycoside hydrolase family 28 protein [Bacteroidales bacterium]MCR5276231.1 glycoside hydrolase family 28 protein [Bacteroidales bacterium]
MKKVLYFIAAALVLVACSSNPSDPWKQADKIVREMTKVSFPDRTVSITDFGAVPDDPNQPCHEAINLAIVTVSLQGGGTVVVPDGVFYTGPITLKSNVNLHLEDNATLKFLTDVDLYFPAVRTRWEGVDVNNAHPLIYAYGETNIALTGKGTIDGQAARDNWWALQQYNERRGHYLNDDETAEFIKPSRLELLKWGEASMPVYERITTTENTLRPQTVNFTLCKTVLIEGVTLLRSPFWVLHPLLCEDLTIRDVTVDNDGPNGDGCDPESCKNVLIEGCTFNTGDDCIAIKSGRNVDGRRWARPSENIVVRNCNMANGHGGVTIGSEISGGYRNLYVYNCKMDSPHLNVVLRIKTSTARGGVIENIFFKDVEVGTCGGAIASVNLRYEPNEVAERGFIPTVRNILIENVTCEKARNALVIDGLDDPENVCNILVKNSTFDGVAAGNSLRGAYKDVTFENCTINGEVINDTFASAQ